MNEKQFCITHADLDGAMSYLLICKYLNRKLPVRPISQAAFSDYWKKTVLPKIFYFEKIYTLDLEICEDYSFFNYNNVFVCDHHKCSIEKAPSLTHCENYLKECSSNSLLLYRSLKEKYGFNLNEHERLLLALVDDYDSYTLKNENSKKLNYLFSSYSGNRVDKFYNDFFNGFKGFNNLQQNSVNIYIRRLTEIIKGLKIYTTNYELNGSNIKFSAAFADFGINDIADYLIKKTGSDMSMVINLKHMKVSFRRSRTSSASCKEVANSICGGSGHDFAAGGPINDKFLEFTKNFIEL